MGSFPWLVSWILTSQNPQTSSMAMESPLDHHGILLFVRESVFLLFLGEESLKKISATVLHDIWGDVHRIRFLMMWGNLEIQFRYKSKYF